MHFSRLRLAGFKSFVEPTEFHVEPGLTGIVGPNGCGKSNLVEAMRWVMGESSAKQLRGGEMDDVIFGGTTERPARNLAEVVLTLDNSDRSAPAAYNDRDEIDVARRIERGSGSVYRVNGREVRARDVQTLFADVSSGARSTALVSQGRIGAIINAKPADRRHLLEEAAGISGLHSRRHEAELRLRAAETNLERLDDVLAALEEQFRGLKRQARQATRYRNLSDHIRRAEAILLHQRWVEANARRGAASEAHRNADEGVAETTRQAAAISGRQAEAAAAVPVLRQAEAEAAAALQRLMVARDALDAEERRLEAARRDLERRLEQIAADIEREAALRSDAANAITRLESEIADIGAAQQDEPAALARSDQALNAAGVETAALEAALTELTRSVVADETREAGLSRHTVELEKRRARLAQRREETGRDRARTQIDVDDNGPLAASKSAASAARVRLDRVRAAVREAETARTRSQAGEDAARETYQRAEAEAAGLRAEASALSELLDIGNPDLWPPMIDAISVQPGYEVALGAALGDDLIAPTDEAAPVHWRSLPALSPLQKLPEGARPLSDYVTGPPALRRRISQIGVLEDEARGAELCGRLAQGQRLVSRSGALWRWDGFTASADASTAAAVRLSQRNRLGDLRAELDGREAQVAETKAEFERAAELARQAALCESEARESLWSADRDFQEARDCEIALARGAAEALSRGEALAETIAGIEVDLAELEAQMSAARDELAALPDMAARRTEIGDRQTTLAEARATLNARRSAHDRLIGMAESGRARRQAIEAEHASWRQRADGAARQLSQFDERRRSAIEERRRLETRPAEIAEQRSGLLDLIADAERKRNRAADALAEAETDLDEILKLLRATEARLADQREERVRRHALIEQIDLELSSIAGQVREKLDCAPAEALASVGMSGDDDLPEPEKNEAKLERLLRERDNMGPVNLRAETEANELNDRITVMQSERDDLVGAIARLRQGIAGLNREGRERLLASFSEVDRHFRDLFIRLFGGGSAHLSLTDAEDPFEAGLEVMASPPGKKLQTMSLLSGGEQALAALALLFAVFQTNPAPICVLDEVDAPLDEHNVDRFCTMLAEIADSCATRFLLVTHHRLTMARMDRLYGVTMAEHGVSQLVSVDLQTAEGMRESA